MTRQVLLDTHDTRRRLLQNATPLAGAALLLAGIAVLTAFRHPDAVGHAAAMVQGPIAIGAGVLLLLLCPLVRVRWALTYKGHAIRFENHVIFGERLYVDDDCVSKGALGYHKVLQGIIRTGDGQGDCITAESDAGLTIFKIRITAESQGPRV